MDQVEGRMREDRMGAPESDEEDVVVRDCRECHGQGFRLSPYLGPDQPRKKTNCAVCNGWGIRIYRRQRTPDAESAAHAHEGAGNGVS